MSLHRARVRARKHLSTTRASRRQNRTITADVTNACFHADEQPRGPTSRETIQPTSVFWRLVANEQARVGWTSWRHDSKTKTLTVVKRLHGSRPTTSWVCSLAVHMDDLDGTGPRTNSSRNLTFYHARNKYCIFTFQRGHDGNCNTVLILRGGTTVTVTGNSFTNRARL